MSRSTGSSYVFLIRLSARTLPASRPHDAEFYLVVAYPPQCECHVSTRSYLVPPVIVALARQAHIIILSNNWDTYELSLLEGNDMASDLERKPAAVMGFARK